MRCLYSCLRIGEPIAMSRTLQYNQIIMARQTRREFLGTAASVAFAAGALSLLPDFAANAAAEPTKRPNILLFFPDEHRFDWVGTTPNLRVRTPNLDALAARGVRFTQAVCPSPLCAPARACLASGMEYEDCRVPGNNVDYPLDEQTFYGLLRDSGYHVMGCGKFDLHKASRGWGLDGKRSLKEWGFSDGIDNAGKNDGLGSSANGPADPYSAFLDKRGLLKTHREDFLKRKRVREAASSTTPLPDDAYCDNWIANNGLKLIDNAPKAKPWFMQVNFNGPHPPWDITQSMEKLYEGVDFPPPNNSGRETDKSYLGVRRNYSAMITNIDRWLGTFVETLKKRGELDNTIIVYSSDHGEMLGDRGAWGKNVPWQPSVGVPLTIAGPGVKRQAPSEALVTNMDLAATFLQYSGVPVPASMDSRSLKPLLQGKTKKHRDHVRSALDSWRMVYDGQYKLVLGYGRRRSEGTSQTLLFDLGKDPLENNNLAAAKPDVVAKMSRLLDEKPGK